MKTVIKAQDIHKQFLVGQQTIEVLKGITLEVGEGDFAIIFGPSGCGKSTLLHAILGLEQPTSGQVVFLDKDLYEGRDEDARSEFRKQNIGMVYQQPNWIKALTVIDNMAFPLLLLGKEKDEAAKIAQEWLEKVDMLEWAGHKPTELSSGQQQRIALARAMVTNPSVIIADEPTGNLDYLSGQKLMQLLQDLNKAGKTVVMVTHDLEYMQFANVAIRIMDGKLVGIYRTEAEKQKLISEIRGKRGVDVEEDKKK